MTDVPPDYQRVLNPWQTRKDIRLQVKFLESLLRKKDPEERARLLRLADPPRDWSQPR